MAWPSSVPVNNNRALSLVVCSIIFPTAATISVIGRFCSRRTRKERVGIDDWTAALSLSAIYTQHIIVILSVFYGGVGHHIGDLTPDNVAASLKLVTVVNFPFGLALALAKVSICFLLLRRFFGRSFRIAAWCIIVYTACWFLMVYLISAALCRPFSFYWDKTIPGGRCGSNEPANICIAVFDILGDIMIIALLIPWIWKLQTSATSRIGLSVISALGFLDVIAAILRIVYLTDTDYSSSSSDFTWASAEIQIWSVIESSLAVIVACSPVLHPMLVSCLPTTSRRSGHSGKQYQRHQEISDTTNSGGYPLCPVDGANVATICRRGSHEFPTGTFAEPTAEVQNPFSSAIQTSDEGVGIIRVENEIVIHSNPDTDIPRKDGGDGWRKGGETLDAHDIV